MAKWAKQLYHVTDEDVRVVRTHFNKTQKVIDKDCEIIKTWMKQQSHFPKDYNKERVERIHLRNKFRIERTKEKLESYYTVKGENPNYFTNIDPDKDIMETALTTVVFVPLPKMHLNMERVYLIRPTANGQLFSVEQPIMLMYAFAELELVHDYSTGVRIICDLQDVSMVHYTNVNVNVLLKSLTLFKECLSGRILHLEFINAPAFMNIILALFKLAFPPGLFKKIRIHNNLESLKTIIDEECLPRDYGGKLKSSKEFHEDVKITLKKNREFILTRGNMISDESKRLGEANTNALFGVNGTFKKINLD